MKASSTYPAYRIKMKPATSNLLALFLCMVMAVIAFVVTYVLIPAKDHSEAGNYNQGDNVRREVVLWHLLYQHLLPFN